MGIKEKIKEIYEKKYKLLILIPLTILFIAIIINVIHVANTGDIINKGVSLSGGTSITVYSDANYKDVEAVLKNEYGAANVDVKNIAGQQGFIVEGANEINSDELLQKIFSITGELAEESYSMEKTGASLGKSFFQEIFRAILVAFLFMGFVVFLYFGHGTKAKLLSFVLTITASILLVFLKNKSFWTTDISAIIIAIFLMGLYFRNSLSSFAVIMSALVDIVVTLAIINIIGLKLSTAGIVAFLMLIGYSVDTDILLATRVLKRKEGTIDERVYDAMKTGIVMTATTMIAVLIAYFITPADAIKQIMLIIFIGLVVDLISTWFQTSGLIKIYAYKMQKMHKKLM